VIFGGGPSLNQADIDYAISRGWRRIACNDAFILDPHADVLVFGDQRWYLWQRHELRKHKGTYKVTWRHVPQMSGMTIHLLLQAKTGVALSTDPTKIAANNTGQGAINLAFLFGAKRILLLGFDMKVIAGQPNWHTRHQKPSKPERMKNVFAPAIGRAAEILKTKGVEVLNCTRDSALTCFPYQDLRTL